MLVDHVFVESLQLFYHVKHVTAIQLVIYCVGKFMLQYYYVFRLLFAGLHFWSYSSLTEK